MNKVYSKITTLIFSIVVFTSCGLNEIDNYDGPNATIHGGIYDIETSELVEQDIIDGMKIEYIEQGFSNPETQYQVVKNDGTFQNKMMFAGKYTMKPTRGNFVSQEAIEVDVKGNTEIKFRVQPYIRIKNGKIEKVNGKIVATFSIQQTIANNVRNVALFAHKEQTVGDPIDEKISVKQVIDGLTAESTVYTIELDPTAHSKMKSGTRYYFRIGALMDAPEAKYNYLPAVRIEI